MSALGKSKGNDTNDRRSESTNVEDILFEVALSYFEYGHLLTRVQKLTLKKMVTQGKTRREISEEENVWPKSVDDRIDKAGGVLAVGANREMIRLLTVAYGRAIERMKHDGRI